MYLLEAIDVTSGQTLDALAVSHTTDGCLGHLVKQYVEGGHDASFVVNIQAQDKGEILDIDFLDDAGHLVGRGRIRPVHYADFPMPCV